MSILRPKGVPGRILPDGETTCCYDGGDDSAPACGKPSTHHVFAGSAEDGPSDWAMFACDQHVARAQELAWDWHETGTLCGKPRTMWQPKGFQGEGHCYMPTQVELVRGVFAEVEKMTEKSYLLDQLGITTALERLNSVRLTFEGLGLIKQEGPTDPRERALWIKKNRNTGPAKPHNGKRTL